MADEGKPQEPKKPLFEKGHDYQIDALIVFLKMCGYKETEKPDVYVYTEDRKTMTQLAGAVHRQYVNVKELAANKEKLGRLVRRMFKKFPHLRERLQEVLEKAANEAPPKA